MCSKYVAHVASSGGKSRAYKRSDAKWLLNGWNNNNSNDNDTMLVKQQQQQQQQKQLISKSFFYEQSQIFSYLLHAMEIGENFNGVLVELCGERRAGSVESVCCCCTAGICSLSLSRFVARRTPVNELPLCVWSFCFKVYIYIHTYIHMWH